MSRYGNPEVETSGSGEATDQGDENTKVPVIEGAVPDLAWTVDGAVARGAVAKACCACCCGADVGGKPWKALV